MQIEIKLSTGTYTGNPSDRQILAILSAIGIDITATPMDGDLTQYNQEIAKTILGAIVDDDLCDRLDSKLVKTKFSPTLPRLLDQMPLNDIMTLLTTLATHLTLGMAEIAPATETPESVKIAETAISS